MGDKKAGFSVFWADDGLDTGPILLQRSCDVKPNDTVDSLYNRFLFPRFLGTSLLKVCITGFEVMTRSLEQQVPSSV